MAAGVLAEAACCGIGWRHPHHQELLRRLPPLPFIEVHSENHFGEGGAARALLLQARAHYPLSLHGVGLGLGSEAGLDPQHLHQLTALVQACEPQRVSDHACFARVPGLGGAQHAADLLPIPFDDDSLARLCQHVEQVQEQLARPLAVENLSAYLGWAQDSLAEPEFFNALTQRTGCQLLLDLNNLLVNALNRAAPDPLQACQQWVDQIRPGSVAEIHLAGHTRLSDGLVIDDHGSQVSEPVWALYRHACARLGAMPTLIEWDTALPTLDLLLAQAQRAEQERVAR